jgi:16S rRNA (uracil1498-N3)-methyltransferase
MIRAELISFDKKQCEIQRISIISHLNVNPNKISIAVGILENRDRFEFALEKAVESGISSFIPLITEYSNRRNINQFRLRSKAISAIKQSNQAFLPAIEEIQTIDELLLRFGENNNIIVCDGSGERGEILISDGYTLILVGPEGGFSENELAKLRESGYCKFLNLGTNILRTETAVAQALGLINYFNH